MRVGTNGFNRAAVVKAINWAAENWDTPQRISVISYSSGAYAPRPEFEPAIRAFCNKGGLFVCATGNNPIDNDLESNYFYPSFYGTDLYENKIPNIISVGRIDINDERPASANWGYSTIDIYAPGQYILSTFPTNMCNENANECKISGHKAYGYHYMSGSSMSTPHVSGGQRYCCR